MSIKILLAGIGGQGVLFAHRVLAGCAVAQGFEVTGAETHGMSQRGGAVVSHLKIGERDAPLIRQGSADLLLAFDASEAYRNMPFVGPGGVVVVNTSLAELDAQVRAQLAKLEIVARLVDADRIAARLGRATVTNVALLGFTSALDVLPFSADALKETLAGMTPARFRAFNEQAFDEGVQVCRDQQTETKDSAGNIQISNEAL